MTVVSTPMDDKLAELNRKIGATLIPYGDKDLRGAVAAKQAASESAPAAAAADRLSYNARTNKAVQGAGELLDALTNNELKLESIDQKKLPSEFQDLSREEMEKRVARAQTDRSGLQKEIAELSKKRDAYLQAENRRLAAEGKGDAFDQQGGGDHSPASDEERDYLRAIKDHLISRGDTNQRSRPRGAGCSSWIVAMPAFASLIAPPVSARTTPLKSGS